MTKETKLVREYLDSLYAKYARRNNVNNRVGSNPHDAAQKYEQLMVHMSKKKQYKQRLLKSLCSERESYSMLELQKEHCRLFIQHLENVFCDD